MARERQWHALHAQASWMSRSPDVGMREVCLGFVLGVVVGYAFTDGCCLEGFEDGVYGFEWGEEKEKRMMVGTGCGVGRREESSVIRHG